MDKRKAMYLINKKPKEIRDILRLCVDIESDGDGQKRKNLYILAGLIYGKPGVGKKLAEVCYELEDQQEYLYSLKYTVIRRDGEPVNVSLKEVRYHGAMCSELAIIYRYEGDLYHLPATEEDVASAELNLPDTYTEQAGEVKPAPQEPISDAELEEAIYIIRRELGKDLIQKPPMNILEKTFRIQENNILK